MLILSKRLCRHRSGFTVVELCAVVALIGILVALLLPAVQAARENARRTNCQNNMMQVALAIRNYQNSYGHFPVQLHGTDGSVVPGADNDGRLSFLVGLLPFIDQIPLAEAIDQEQEYGSGPSSAWESDDESQPSRLWPRNGPEPFAVGYPPWQSEVPTYRCPSDPGYGANADFGGGAVNGRTNYAACLGDGCLTAATGPYKQIKGTLVFDELRAKQTNAAMRGAFVPRVPTRDADITDGIAYTLLLGEIGTSLGGNSICRKPGVAVEAEQLLNDPGLVRTVEQKRKASGEQPLLYYPRRWNGFDDPQITVDTGLDSIQERGLNWVDGMPLYTGFNTILPPNREIVLSAARDDCWGVLPPSSYHQGGANIAMVDGAVRFISDEIDAGSAHQPTVYLGSPTPPGSPSPYGVWGAMGTRSSSELANLKSGPN
jgi:prepilin-type processing-associated H-X9-DG protein